MLAVDWNLPVSHAAQCAADSCDCSEPLPYRPAEHATQALLPVASWYCPALQAEHAADPALLHWPRGQASHAAAPGLLKSPAAHGAQLSTPASLWNLPPSHCLQSVALAPLYCPAEHEMHDADPVSFVNLPAMHASQYVMPSALWILPVSHAAQCALDVCALVDLPYWPAVHSVQLALVSKLHEPAAHCPLHELLAEPPVPNRPAAQSAHAVRPVSL